MARQGQKTGPVIKSARTASATPNYTPNQPGGLIYSPLSAPPSVVKDQGNNIIPLIATTVGRASKAPLALIGNGNITGVFELGANPKEARVRFTTQRIVNTGKEAYGNAVAFSASDDIVSITDVTGNAVAVGPSVAGARATGHLVSDSVTGVYSGVFLYLAVGEKFLVLTFGNETYILALLVV